jgi:hypothetical protein
MAHLRAHAGRQVSAFSFRAVQRHFSSQFVGDPRVVGLRGDSASCHGPTSGHATRPALLPPTLKPRQPPPSSFSLSLSLERAQEHTHVGEAGPAHQPQVPTT